MEDNTKQPLTADASLYNGQPTDTGSSCPSARLTSCTPSISEDTRNGVSVENVLNGNKQWFVLRVSYRRVQKPRRSFKKKCIESYVLQNDGMEYILCILQKDFVICAKQLICLNGKVGYNKRNIGRCGTSKSMDCRASGHDYDAVSKWYTNTLQPDLQTSVKITEMLRMNIRELVVDRNKY